MYTIFDVSIPNKYYNNLESLKIKLEKLCLKIHEIDSSVPRQYIFSVIETGSAHDKRIFPTIVAQNSGANTDDKWDVLNSINVVSEWLAVNDF